MASAPDISYHVSDTMPAPQSEPPSMPADDTTYEEWIALWTAYRVLGPTARKVLARIAERLVMGRKQYNDDFEKPRNWPRESLEEALDLGVYLSVALIKASEK